MRAKSDLTTTMRSCLILLQQKGTNWLILFSLTAEPATLVIQRHASALLVFIGWVESVNRTETSLEVGRGVSRVKGVGSGGMREGHPNRPRCV
jgi:hypothetical protein